ncbi:MAG: thiolase family protein [Candidatus Zixiibacteriota bacterium]|nr:MAG: thiolase family protein [candidate division Zixibacteria bacterium]
MGLTAEKLAAQYGISRDQQDEFTIESNRRFFQAKQNGDVARELVPIHLSDGTVIDADQEPRESTPEQLAALRTPFKENGTVTAANSSGVSDGACVAIVGDVDALRTLGVMPLARVVATATVGLDPTLMGLGPGYAIPRLLQKAGLTLDDIDLFEINEAFAVQVLACQRELGIPSEKLNVNGGAVALGHPLGMSGLRIAVTLAHTMAARDARRGVASMCVGHGQGVAMLLERE